MGALSNAIRKILGTGERPASGGLVLAARHYDRVNQTVRRVEARAEARRPQPGSAAAVAQPAPMARLAADPALQQPAARPNLAEWDLPPGLASVVQADAGGREAPSARRATGGPGARERKSPEEPPRRVPLQSAEMEALLSRLAE